MLYFYSLIGTKLMADIGNKKIKTHFFRKYQRNSTLLIDKAPKKGALLRLFAFKKT